MALGLEQRVENPHIQTNTFLAPVRVAAELAHRYFFYPYITSGRAQEDRDWAHKRGLRLMQIFEDDPNKLALVEEAYRWQDPKLELETGGVKFNNPFGIEAGILKNVTGAKYVAATGEGYRTGGGFVKTEYWRAFPGNDGQHLYYLPEDDAFINRYGYKTSGMRTNLPRIKRTYFYDLNSGCVFVGSVSPCKLSFETGTPTEDMVETAELIDPYVQVLQYSGSSPNTKGNLSYNEPENWEYMCKSADESKKRRGSTTCLEMKMGSDDSRELLDFKVSTAIKYGFLGFVAANTMNTALEQNADEIAKLRSKHRDKFGGLSGAPIFKRNLEICRYIALEHIEPKLKENPNLYVVSCGGIDTSYKALVAMMYGHARRVGRVSGYVGPKGSPGQVRGFKEDFSRFLHKTGAESVKDIIGQEYSLPTEEQWKQMMEERWFGNLGRRPLLQPAS